MPSLAESLQEILDQKGISQKVLAHAARMHPGDISRIVSGKTSDPGWSTVLRIAQALKVNLDDLARGRPNSQLTPYDVDHLYRDLIDALDVLPRHHRDKIIAYTTWIASVCTVPDDTGQRRGRRQTRDATKPNAMTDGRRLAAQLERLPASEQRRFHEALAQRDMESAIRIGPSRSKE